MKYTDRVLHHTLPERLRKHIDVSAPTGCWTWTGAFDRDYPRVGATKRVHRVIYVMLVGPIDDGMVVHHTCENKGCVNPEHLQQMTRRDHGAEHYPGNAAFRKHPGGHNRVSQAERRRRSHEWNVAVADPSYDEMW